MIFLVSITTPLTCVVRFVLWMRTVTPSNARCPGAGGTNELDGNVIKTLIRPDGTPLGTQGASEPVPKIRYANQRDPRKGEAPWMQTCTSRFYPDAVIHNT